MILKVESHTIINMLKSKWKGYAILLIAITPADGKVETRVNSSP
jgi:hypothetical protein